MKHYSLVVILFFSGILLGQRASSVTIEDEIIWNEGKDTLYGSLILPFELQNLSETNKGPIVIFIPGSGPTDRNGNSEITGGKNNGIQSIADSLLARGIASFRYDKAGVGKSTLSSSEADLRFEDNVRMVKAIYQKITSLGFHEIFLFGHSEGSLVAILSAQSISVKGIISAAGPARNAAEVLETQLRSQLLDPMKTQVLQKLDSLKNGNNVTNPNPLLASLLRPSVQPYLISWFQYTPTVEIAQLDIPIMIVQGDRDIQVTTAAAEALDHYAKESSLNIYPGMNHIFKAISNDVENKNSYSDPSFPLEMDMVKDMSIWIKTQL